jgi:putative Mg2+ transporter-C (MgtC) family protein
MDLVRQAFIDYWSAPEVGANVLAFLNILGALVLGIIVGYERSYRGRAAGMRTYGMVCMVSCALTVVAGYPEFWYGGKVAAVASADPTRVIQGITTGVGFLGAGVITRDGLSISGLTTAASIWTVSGIGVLVGVGFYGAAILLAFLSVAFMLWGGKLEDVLPARHAVSVTLHFLKGMAPEQHIIKSTFLDHGYEIANGSFSISGREGKPEWRFVVISHGKNRSSSLINLGGMLSSTEGVESFHLAHARN